MTATPLVENKSVSNDVASPNLDFRRKMQKTISAVDNRGRLTKIELPKNFHAKKIITNVAVDGIEPMSLFLRVPSGCSDEQKWLDDQLKSRADEGWKVGSVQRFAGGLNDTQPKYLLILTKMKTHKCRCDLCREMENN